MRIAVDIDSTLHDYWSVISAISMRRFGIELPYEEQLTWGLTRLRASQFELCVSESHSDECILAGVPYPGAVETVRAWHDAGHTIHVASYRDGGCCAATAAWLHAIGLPYDELICSSEKVPRCAALGVELLVDDSPLSLLGALERDMLAATLAHPWNEDVCEEEPVIRAADWPSLAQLLAPVLGKVCATALP
jgi:hypothetical protein